MGEWLSRQYAALYKTLPTGLTAAFPIVPSDRVFGIMKGIPLSYIERSGIDDTFRSALTSEEFIVIHGTSKQGKTTLRNRHLAPNKFVTVHCQHHWDTTDINEAILEAAGYNENVRPSERLGSARSSVTQIEASAHLSPAEVKGVLSGTREQKSLRPWEPAHVTQVLSYLKFKKVVVLENFHYLRRDTQVEFAKFLRTYHETSSVKFVVVAVWPDGNRLLSMNGDLAQRMVSIDADHWSEADLSRVISAGEKKLRVAFDDDFKKTLIESSFGSVYVVQQACKMACQMRKIHVTCFRKAKVVRTSELQEVIGKLAKQERQRFENFLRVLSEGRSSTKLEIPKWFSAILVTADDRYLESGISIAVARDFVLHNNAARQNVRPYDILNFFQGLLEFQREKGISPPIVDYDAETKRAVVIDRSFLVWRRHVVGKENLLNMCQVLEVRRGVNEIILGDPTLRSGSMES